MRRRVIQLEQGHVIRDEAAGFYTGDESTREFAARMRDGDPGPDAAPAPRGQARRRRAARESTRCREERGLMRLGFFFREATRSLRAAPCRRSRRWRPCS